MNRIISILGSLSGSAQPPGRSAGSTRISNFGKTLLRIITVTTALLCLTAAFGQSVTITPNGYVTAAPGATVQFSANVTGETNTAVYWYAGGKKGGSTTNGTISATGLYTAPTTMPGQNPVAIKAVSQASSTVAATVYVYLLNAGPTITSVSPNPISVGNLTVTIKGSGFLQYAQVVDTYNGTPVQLSTVSVTSDTIVASGWQGNAPNASFTVTNPGSAPSNAIVVPISNGVQTYPLTVNSGSGSGSYASGAVVSITANTAPAGQTFLNWTGATVANPTAANTTLTMPAAATTVTANYTAATTKYTLSVNNGSGSGSYTAGTVVTITANAPPAGSIFSAWTGASVASSTSATTTLTMPAATTTVSATYAQVAQIPYPVASHPRLWVTPNDIPRLQSWAVSTNPTYQTGMLPLLSQAVNIYQTQFFPNGVANPTYPDLGDTQGYQGQLTEEVGFILAFNSLIDPNATNRIKYAQYARNLIMVAMNQAVLGPLANAPFRDPMFPVYNRANETGAQWPLIVDWIYNTKDANGNPILTAADKATIRKVFLLWANECLNAYTTGGDHPSPVGTVNSFSLIGNGTAAYRMASNNYYLGHARLVTMMGLCIDPSDDPVNDPTQSPAIAGNTLRSYILNGTGAWLYQTYAMMGDPQTVKADYNLPGTGANFGLASGGLPPEGMLYGHSFGFVLGQLLALQTAGFNNQAISGPQIKLITAPVWDRFVKGYLSSLTPTSMVPASEVWLGPVYQMASYGDLLRLYITPETMQSFALLALLEQEQGLNTHANAARWISTSVVPNGVQYNVSQPWTWGCAQSILYYMLLDPGAAPATDPRPAYPLNFFDPAAGRVLAHSNWGTTGSWFDYRASWESINHQDGDGGQFEFFRNGEWLTKEMSNYDNNGVGLTTYYHNTLALQNWCANGTPNLNWFEAGEWTNGSNWILGMNAGDPKTTTSNGTGYTYVSSDLTNLYNRPNVWTPAAGATDIAQATRQVVWLNSDYLVVYDRATSLHSGLFKTFNLCMANNPVITGNTATETMADGQKLFVQSLLPAGGSLSSAFASGNLNPHSELDPMQYVLTVQDKTLPADTRFLHVLQGADASASMVQATYLASASGTSFDGAALGSSAVFFPTKSNAAFTTTTFTVPSTVHTFVVVGLTGGAGYSVTTTVAATGTTVVVSSSATGTAADSAGLLKVAI